MGMVLLFISSFFILAMSIMMWRGITKDYSNDKEEDKDSKKA